MNYVNSFDLFGVPAKQIPATPGSGVPTEATEGAVGCLYMDINTGDLYKCTAADSGVYTWVKCESSESSGIELPALTNPGTASDLVKDKELIDQDGNVVTGTVKEVASGSTHTTTGADVTFLKATDYTDPFFRFSVKQVGDALLRAGSTISLSADPSKFGTATAEDVVEGKTFTAEGGVKLTGTHVCEGSGASAGLVVKNGSTTEQTFDTGLSSVSYLVLYKETHTTTGLMEGFFAKDFCRYVYCDSYSDYFKTASFGTDTSNYSFDGGTFSLATTGTSGFSSDVAYYWYAFGTE